MCASVMYVNQKALIATGLTPLQAQTYALLLEKTNLKPPDLASHLTITRTNAYKVLDKLVGLGLATKVDSGNKIAYAASSPLALADMAAQTRAEAVAREDAVGAIMHDLLATYHTHSDRPHVTVVTGRKAVANAYRKQLNLREDVFFIHTPSDVALMGFDTMHEIRSTPARYGLQRTAIMAAKSPHETINYAAHKRTNLAITWTSTKDYSAPVEWSITASSLLIILYATEPHAIFIDDAVVAGAFLQLFKLLNSLLAQQPLHQALRPAE